MAQKIDRQKLQQYFIEALKGEKVILLDGLNPFHVEIDEKEYYIYIKNLSPATFRIQMYGEFNYPLEKNSTKSKNLRLRSFYSDTMLTMTFIQHGILYGQSNGSITQRVFPSIPDSLSSKMLNNQKNLNVSSSITMAR